MSKMLLKRFLARKPIKNNRVPYYSAEQNNQAIDAKTNGYKPYFLNRIIDILNRIMDRRIWFS